jgi:hypothetical protein
MNYDSVRMWMEVVWANWRNYHSICLEGQRKTMKNCSQDGWSLGKGLNPRLPVYQDGMLTTRRVFSNNIFNSGILKTSNFLHNNIIKNPKHITSDVSISASDSWLKGYSSHYHF